MDLITTSSPTSFFSTPRTPTGRMLSNKHVSEVSMQMAGSVCSFAYNYHFLHLHLAFDKCFGKCFLLSFYQEHMNYILIWTGTYHHHLVPPLLIVLWRHILWRPVPSPYNVDLVWSGIRQSLSTCGGIYNYRAEVVGGEGTLGSGGNGPIWKEVLVLESYQYSYIFIPPLQYLQYPEPEGLYVNTLQFWDISW